MFTSLELCAGGGGQALGLEAAGFEPLALVDEDPHACTTLQHNRPSWNVLQGDLRELPVEAFCGVDLLAAGLPCPPFSKAGKQLGADDERDLFPHALRIIDECRPRAVMIENVRGFLGSRFESYREQFFAQLQTLGYTPLHRLHNAAHFGVSQMRVRVVIVALRHELAEHFSWPRLLWESPPPVGAVLHDLMAANGWPGAARWSEQAQGLAPTIVGGSKKHGGPDLGPTRAKEAWRRLGVDGRGIADHAPEPDFVGMPRLTVPMVARLQGFPPEWHFAGRKTHTYRQVGNAFPPPVAQAVGEQLRHCLEQVTYHSIAI